MNRVKEEGKRWSRPDACPTLHMWLWLTFHLSLSFPLSINPSIPCFSPLCQDVGSVSRHGVRPSHKPVFPPPAPLTHSISSTSTNSLLIDYDNLWPVASVQSICQTETSNFLKMLPHRKQLATKWSLLYFATRSQ